MYFWPKFAGFNEELKKKRKCYIEACCIARNFFRYDAAESEVVEQGISHAF